MSEGGQFLHRLKNQKSVSRNITERLLYTKTLINLTLFRPDLPRPADRVRNGAK